MKTIIKIFICLSLIYTPFFANASAAEKWTIEEITYDNVAKNIKIQAEKNYGPSANDNTYKVKVPVSASAAGSTALSMIRMGLAGAALYGLVEGVGWIIENGVVKKPNPDHDPISLLSGWGVGDNATLLFATPSEAMNQFCAAHNYKTCTLQQWITKPSQSRPYGYYTFRFVLQSGSAGLNAIVPKNRSESNPDSPQYVPVTPSEMGQEIIDSPSAPQILPDIYNPNNPVRPSPAPDAADRALENAPPIPKQNPKGDTQQKPNEDTDGDGQPDTFNPDKPSVGTEFTLPEFCSWAVTVCEWYTKYKEDSDLAKEHREAEKQVWTQEEIARQEEKQQREDEKSFWQKVEDWFDWTQADDDLPENESLDIGEHVTPDLKEDAISWGAACPADVSIPISMQGVSSTLVFSWGPWCQLLSIIKPAIIASAYIGAAFIVLGLRT